MEYTEVGIEFMSLIPCNNCKYTIKLVRTYTFLISVIIQLIERNLIHSVMFSS